VHSFSFTEKGKEIDKIAESAFYVPDRKDFNLLISRGSPLWNKKDRSKMARNLYYGQKCPSNRRPP
jgi:hypothetical protein